MALFQFENPIQSVSKYFDFLHQKPINLYEFSFPIFSVKAAKTPKKTKINLFCSKDFN